MWYHDRGHRRHLAQESDQSHCTTANGSRGGGRGEKGPGVWPAGESTLQPSLSSPASQQPLHWGEIYETLPTSQVVIL